MIFKTIKVETRTSNNRMFGSSKVFYLPISCQLTINTSMNSQLSKGWSPRTLRLASFQIFRSSEKFFWIFRKIRFTRAVHHFLFLLPWNQRKNSSHQLEARIRIRRMSKTNPSHIITDIYPYWLVMKFQNRFHLYYGWISLYRELIVYTNLQRFASLSQKVLIGIL